MGSTPWAKRPSSPSDRYRQSDSPILTRKDPTDLSEWFERSKSHRMLLASLARWGCAGTCQKIIGHRSMIGKIQVSPLRSMKEILVRWVVVIYHYLQDFQNIHCRNSGCRRIYGFPNNFPFQTPGQPGLALAPVDLSRRLTEVFQHQIAGLGGQPIFLLAADRWCFASIRRCGFRFLSVVSWVNFFGGDKKKRHLFRWKHAKVAC